MIHPLAGEDVDVVLAFGVDSRSMTATVRHRPTGAEVLASGSSDAVGETVAQGLDALLGKLETMGGC